MNPISLTAKLASFSEMWSPKVVAEINDHQFKLAKFEGDFVWHVHAATDEAFLVLAGSMTVHFRHGDVNLRAGELLVVPRGVEHKTSAARECHALIVEKCGTVNTGDIQSSMTTSPDAWI